MFIMFVTQLPFGLYVDGVGDFVVGPSVVALKVRRFYVFVIENKKLCSVVLSCGLSVNNI